MKTSGPPLPVRRAEGAFLELEDGRRIVDCISSWWVTLHGHGNREIADAIYEQAQRLEHVIFAGFTHEPAQELSTLLLKHLPNNFNRVFFSDNGSTSVEVALKMSVQYWCNIGQPQRKRFIGFDGGYHGDTVGAMSAGGSSAFWTHFRSLMFDIETVPFPATHDADELRTHHETESIQALEQLLAEHPGEYAAVIIEPLVQGAAGMRMCSESYLQRLQEVVQKTDTLLIYDEVMTGFGRTGDWFACTKSKTQPDIICLSKGITGGFLPLSVTICTDRIYDAFYADELEKAFFHSHSYTGNPIACAAGVASMKLLEKTENVFKSWEERNRRLWSSYLEPLESTTRPRFCGTIFAFDLDLPGDPGYFNERAPQLRAEFLKRGLLLRPLGHTIYMMPPYCTDNETLESAVSTIRDVVSGIM
jgi:adenosylmethionine-8-amino-7-oxononanoate aminotransferase